LSKVWLTSPKAVMFWLTELSTVVSRSSMNVVSLSSNRWFVMLTTFV